MSEADRVFPRQEKQVGQNSAGEKRFITSAPRRGGLGGSKSRVVEVVHVRSGRSKPAEQRSHPSSRNTRAEMWPDGFRAKSALLPMQHGAPPATPAPVQPTAHVMPAWAPSPQQSIQPVTASADPPTEVSTDHRRPRISKSAASRAPTRRFADPFADDDSGANCLRCGYLIEKVREQRNLLTCAACG